MAPSEVVQDLKLDIEQYNMLLYFEQYYWRRGGIPTYAQMVEDGVEGLTETAYLETWNNRNFVNALAARGVPRHLLVTESGTLNGKILTEQQMTVANVLLDTLDKRARVKKLMELGVSTQTYSSWLKDPVYRNYCLERAESLLHENQSVAHMALLERVHQGDLGAIKYFNALTNRYVEKASAAVEINVDQRTQVNGQEQLIAIIEIIQRHVKDPETLEAIGTDILKMRDNIGNTAPAPVAVAASPFRRSN